MKLHVLRGGRIVPLAGGDVAATIVDGNPLGDPKWALPPTVPSGLVVMSSGWIPESDGAGAGTSGLATWGPIGRAAFESLCDRLAAELAPRKATVLFRSHARHVLSDAPSCIKFLQRRAGEPFGLLLDPVAMLARGMLPRAEEHLARILGALAPNAATWAVLLANAEPAPDGALRPAPITRGAIAPGVIAAAAAALPSATRVVLLDADVDAQAALLRSAPRSAA